MLIVHHIRAFFARSAQLQHDLERELRQRGRTRSR